MKRVFTLMLICLLSIFLMIPVFASDTRTGVATDSGSSSSSAEWTPENIGKINDEALNGLIEKNVTTSGLVSRLESKGNDVVKILQTVEKYVCIGGFVVCCILSLVGIIGNKKVLAGGIIGLIISGMAYAGIVCGREIVNWIAAWAVS